MTQSGLEDDKYSAVLRIASLHSI